MDELRFVMAEFDQTFRYVNDVSLHVSNPHFHNSCPDILVVLSQGDLHRPPDCLGTQLSSRPK
jgi:hypothetical protein